VPQRASAAPRGRHAPPLEIRQDQQRRRLFAAAAAVFARTGYGEATAEAIAREAGMSKATFYEHFANKEECIVALFDTAIEVIIGAMRAAGEREVDSPPAVRVRASAEAFLGALEQFPDEAQTLLVEIVGAGPRALERRDRALEAVAQYLEELNAQDTEHGVTPRLAEHDAFAIVGAVVELASRQIRTGVPAHIRDLEPVLERLTLGLLAAGARP
jgi:AcrR family transcriptional regulator